VPNIPEEVQNVCRTLRRAGFSAHLVGGCVRDILLNIEPHDYDVTTDARPEEMMALFGAAALPTGLAHGTVTVSHVEITTYRTDGEYTDARHPTQVTFTRSLADDLARRDFTVNAIAMTPEGEITDPYGGRDDLSGGVLRAVGEAQVRFHEDALRILRGLRFSAVLGFSLEPQTARAIRESAPLLHKIAPERIREEMEKLLCGKNVLPVLLAYPDVLGVFLPELLPAVGFDQRNRHHCYDVWTHIAHSVASVPPEPVLRWTMLFHDLKKPACFTLDARGVGHFRGHAEAGAALAREIMARLRFDKKTVSAIEQLVAWHDRDIPRTDRGVRRALAAMGAEQLWRLMEVKRADNLAQHPDFRAVQGEIRRAEEILSRLLAQQTCVTLQQLAVNGRDMMELGLSGREVGTMLHALLQQVVDEALPNEHAALLQWAAENQ
jgi:tRNA nucleotidyltransferase (CCA-adding enzyme)